MADEAPLLIISILLLEGFLVGREKCTEHIGSEMTSMSKVTISSSLAANLVYEMAIIYFMV